MNKIVVNLGNFKLDEITLSRGSLTIGRASDNDISLADTATSSYHAKIVTIFTSSFIQDLNSKNGTIVNGRRILRHTLSHGDLISIGNLQLLFNSDVSSPSPKKLDKTIKVSQGEIESALSQSGITSDEIIKPDNVISAKKNKLSGLSISIPPSTEKQDKTSSIPELSVPEPSVPEPSVPESSVPELSIPESSVPELSIPQSSVPELSIPQSSAPEPSIPELSIPELSIPEPSIPELSIPESSIPESSIPESSIPELSVPELSVPEPSVPELSVPESSVPESSVPESSAPESSIPESSIPESSIPELSVPETSMPQWSIPESSIPESSTLDTSIPKWSIPESSIPVLNETLPLSQLRTKPEQMVILAGQTSSEQPYEEDKPAKIIDTKSDEMPGDPILSADNSEDTSQENTLIKQILLEKENFDHHSKTYTKHIVVITFVLVIIAFIYILI